MSYDDDEEPRRRKKKGKGFFKFLTMQRIAIIVLFLAGLIIGGAITHMYIEPILMEGTLTQLKDCNTSLNALDEQFNIYKSCTDKLGITNPVACVQ